MSSAGSSEVETLTREKEALSASYEDLVATSRARELELLKRLGDEERQLASLH